MINLHPSLYYLLLEALVVFILLTAILSFFQIKHYLKRKKTLIDIVYKLKENGPQRKEELIRLLKKQGEMDEEQLSMISNEIMKNETVFYQYIIHALVKVDLNQLADLDKHVEVLINSVRLARKIETGDSLEQFTSDLSELRTTVQEVRKGQCQLMSLMTQAPMIPSETTIDTPNPNKQTDESEAVETIENLVDDLTAPEPLDHVNTKNSPEENNIDTHIEPLSEIKESKITDEVDPDDIINNILAQPSLPTKKPTMPEEETATKQNEPQPSSLAIEDDIDAILDAEIESTEKKPEKPEKPEEIDIDALIEEVADENKSVLIEKSTPKVKEQTPSDKADDILDEINNIEPSHTEEPTYQGIETETPQEKELEKLLK